MVQFMFFVELEDCVGVCLNSMFLGYLMELFLNGFELNLVGQFVEDVYLWCCIWFFLVVLLGQYDCCVVVKLFVDLVWCYFVD